MSGMLINERFVAVFPSLVRALGSLEAAVILQFLHFCAEADGTIRVSMLRISEETGISERTVARKVKWLRDEGYVSAVRAGTFDATMVYSIDHARLAGSTSHNGGLDPATLAASDPAKMAASSIQNEEVDTSVVREVTTSAPHTDRAEPATHPMRAITHTWSPRREFVDSLLEQYEVLNRQMLAESCQKFVDFNIERGNTSRSWESAFRRWVSNDAERARAQKFEGTDDLGIPRVQRRSTTATLQPGDPGYVDPDDLASEAADQASKRPRRPTTD